MSTPPEPGQPARRRAIEPTHVQRRRRTEALAQLLREVREQQYGADPDGDYEVVAVAATPAKSVPPAAGEETEELPPVPGGEDYAHDGGPAGVGSGSTGVASGSAGVAPGPARRTGRVPAGARGNGPRPARGRQPGPGRRPTRGQAHEPGRRHADGAGHRRAAIALGVTAAALAGFSLALLLPGDQDGRARAGQPGTSPSATVAAPAPPGFADPDGAGTLREGDSGPEVAALQKRLLRVPDVYTGGSTDGSYDVTLTAAVARFQLWYGIRGDETGVYGDDTRTALESRTRL
ncbi:peptidoglycan-binding protein [Streptomyces sp. NPDC059668]|uniref:peptidoglycan-binding protein n=1 Tax=Streptomyces sp. NPDC059668 TaxID=3346900 RepID=UPI0036934A4C